MLSACAAPNSVNSIRPGMPVLAADLAQNRLAQDSDVIAALGQTAAPEAILFAPGPVDAKSWLSGQEPFPDTAWQGHLVAVSCDGLMGAVTGAITWEDYPGYYTTIWRYDADAEGSYGQWRWTLSHGDGLDEPRPAPQIPLNLVASCENLPAVAELTEQFGQSPDGSLRYRWNYSAEAGRMLTVEIWDGAAFKTVIEDTVPTGQAE
ncbi:hypothetical protein [Erythrobacter crassostreae]|uniref:Uncharacterized protein n=1 Tax=Erythrobacter crassostreae TaxID=2828328 RepID=A0A9X1F222_9SPHN|nr:hypothetical protein [Erythrobacter crassostrea]MBV7258871.1 hypothetical protein [Erythrobacter crassostrea]